MPVAEIIAIGTELLLGDIQDSNTRYLARKLRDAGIDLFRATIIGDNVIRIADAVQESLGRAQIIVTTGGLGPTVDDPTRQAVAMAFGLDIEYHPELWEQIQERFNRFGRLATDNNRRQAYIPAGAVAIENPVGTAPAFLMETGDSVVISLPGVPREMEYLIEHKVLPYLLDKYQINTTIHERIFHLAGVGESQVDELIGDLETWGNPTVGLLAHPGQVDIRVAAKAGSVEEAGQLINSAAELIQERLAEHIYGSDDETLENVIQRHVEAAGLDLHLVECGLGGQIFTRLVNFLSSSNVHIQNDPCPAQTLEERLLAVMNSDLQAAGLAVTLELAPKRQTLSMLMLKKDQRHEAVRYYGGPPANAAQWAVNSALDFLRRSLAKG